LSSPADVNFHKTFTDYRTDFEESKVFFDAENAFDNSGSFF
jgi:hypothetical protein